MIIAEKKLRLVEGKRFARHCIATGGRTGISFTARMTADTSLHFLLPRFRLPKEGRTLDVCRSTVLFGSAVTAVPKLKGNQRFNGKMAFDFVPSAFDTCALRTVIENCFSAFADARTGRREPSRRRLSVCLNLRSAEGRFRRF